MENSTVFSKIADRITQSDLLSGELKAIIPSMGGKVYVFQEFTTHVMISGADRMQAAIVAQNHLHGGMISEKNIKLFEGLMKIILSVDDIIAVDVKSFEIDKTQLKETYTR